MKEIYIDIDSTYRDRKLFSNPCDIQIERSNKITSNIDNARNIICDSSAIPLKLSIVSITKNNEHILFNINKLSNYIPEIVGQYLQFNYGFYDKGPINVRFLKIQQLSSNYFITDIPNKELDKILYDNDIISINNTYNNFYYNLYVRKTLPVYPKNGEYNKINNNSKDGAVCSVSVVNWGQNYVSGDKLKIIGGDNNCILDIFSKDNKHNILRVIDPGSGYILNGEYCASIYGEGKGIGCMIKIESCGTRVDIDENINFNYKNTFFNINDKISRIINKFNNCLIIPHNSIHKSYLKKDQIYDILEFTEDGVKDMKLMTNEDQDVEISLINLIIPNYIFPNTYPYLYVEFYSGSKRRTMYQSNNPNLNGVTFKCIVGNINEDDNYIILCGLNSIKNTFNMSENITFRIITPDGEVLKLNCKDNKIPNRPNKSLQVNATFYLRTL